MSPNQKLANRLAQITQGLPRGAAERALTEDHIGLLTVLLDPTSWPEGRLSAVDRARLEGARYRRELLEQAGGALSVGEAAKLLGISPQAVRKRIKDHSLIGIPGAKGYAIPNIQFQDESTLPHLGEVLKAMPVDSAWMQLDWLMSPEPRLGDESPVNLLKKNKGCDAVLAAAALVGEHGAG